MRKVIDSNYLRSEKLRRYLAASRHNMAVLTDYAAMEAYKGRNPLLNIQSSMAILAEYPAQVVVLKSTLIVCGLNGRGKGLQSRLIDESQTRDFSGYCRGLAATRAGSPLLQRQLLAFGQSANEHLDGQMLRDAPMLPSTLEMAAAAYSADELAALRIGVQLPDSMMRKLVVQVFGLALELLRTHPRVRKLPDRQELPNALIFRIALCIHLWVFDWLAVGGATAASGVSLNRLRNDLVDITFAAYATFFDGLLSDDQRTCRIYEAARLQLGLIRDAFVHPV